MPNPNEPVGNTCPLIDACISEVDTVLESVDRDVAFEDLTVNDLKDLFEAVKDFDWSRWEARMEEIREANDSLRQWGNEWCEEAEDFEKKNDDLSEQVSNLEAQLNDAQEEINQLESKW